MDYKQIKLTENEVWPLLNVLNEVCHGIYISSFENAIGVEKSRVVELMDRIAQEEHKKDVVLYLSAYELDIIEKSFDQVFREIDSWEFQTRIGIEKQDAKKIKGKICEFG